MHNEANAAASLLTGDMGINLKFMIGGWTGGRGIIHEHFSITKRSQELKLLNSNKS